jgi:hypothetical protein
VPHRQIALLAALLTAVLASAPAGAVPGGWSLPVRVLAARSTPAHSLAVDGLGNVHIAVEGGATAGIVYVTNQTGSWTHKRVTTHTDLDPSIGIDADGFVHIAFARSDAGSKGIYIATNRTGPWVETLRHAGADRTPTLALRGARTYLAFKTAGGSLMYQSDASSSWQSHTVEVGCCAGAPSMRLTTAGQPRIAYSRLQHGVAGALRFASRNAGGGWTLQTADTASSSSPTLVLGDANDPWIVYVRHLGGTYFAHRNAYGSNWGQTQLNSSAHVRPDMAVYHAAVYFVYGTPKTLYYSNGSGGIIFGQVMTNTHHDSSPEIELVGGGVRVVFNRASGTSADGIVFTGQ